MAVIAECLIHPSGYPLGPEVEVPEGVTVDVERVVPTATGMLPYLWVNGDEDTIDDFVGDLRESSAVASVRTVDRFEESVLCQVEWVEDGPALPRRIAEEGVTLLEVRGREDGWLFRVRSPDRGSIERLHDYCLDMEMRFDLMRIYVLSESQESPPQGLTAEQYEALVAAYRAGYYDEPRGTTLEELSERFDITPRAISRRLRRGTATLVRNSLGVERDVDRDGDGDDPESG
jgi:predicted DNA binding protein